MSTSNERPLDERLTEAFQAMGKLVTEQSVAPARVPDAGDAPAVRSLTGWRWTVPLLAAAAVIAVLIATSVVAHSLVSSPVRPGESGSTPTPVPSSSSASPSETPTTSASPSESGSPSGSPSATRSHTAPAIAQIADLLSRTVETDTPTESFEPRAAPVTTSDGHGGTFTAVLGLRTPFASAHGYLVFFWHDHEFVGWDNANEALTTVSVEAAGAGAFAVTYENFAEKDATCCPSLPRVTITYRWSSTSFKPDGAVPLGVLGLNSSYAHPVPFGLRGASAAWTEPTLLITPTSLGAVKNGMSVAQAEQAAGMPFPGSGDGAHYPMLTSPDAPHLYLRPQGDPTFFPPCVGVSGNGRGSPTVMTAEGFRLGDSVTKLKALYGDDLTYMPLPTTGGLAPHAGYVLDESAGRLVFAFGPSAADTITEIAASTGQLSPSGCPG